MAESSDSAPPSALIWEEDGLGLDDEDDDGVLQNDMAALCNEILALEADGEYVEWLLSREKDRESRTRDSSPESSCDPARSGAIRWIVEVGCHLSIRRSVPSSLGSSVPDGFPLRFLLQAQRCFRFGLRTAYTAVAYFDRFFAHKTIDTMKGKTWAVKLLSVACLSLAAKMEEHSAPAVSEFRVKGFRFSSEAAQRMELFVLSTLEWRMLTVTPFAYLNAFASKFDERGLKGLISKAIDFIFAAIEVMNLVDFQPSTIAAAAVLAAWDGRLTKRLVESKTSLLSCCGSLDTEHVFSCYSVIVRESHKQKARAAKFLASSETSPANRESTTGTGCTASLATTSSKRRRLQ
ncbi:Cyclin, N-terminal domain [Musa troglodytarum]|uniref:Cyclin, N-terminal domain n=1 Tax=Musa troglodytarum TaxID=320322 RepID=A0A9E7FDP9_9LILI|nr:Cyclin, N-terminal domain [Musa troglodytarum]